VITRGADESWILEVVGALEPTVGGSGVVLPSRGANQELSSCWKVMLGDGECFVDEEARN
jgi:hypothetical protein